MVEVDGTHLATWVDSTHFTIPISVTTTGTGGTWQNLNHFTIPIDVDFEFIGIGGTFVTTEGKVGIKLSTESSGNDIELDSNRDVIIQADVDMTLTSANMLNIVGEGWLVLSTEAIAVEDVLWGGLFWVTIAAGTGSATGGVGDTNAGLALYADGPISINSDVYGSASTGADGRITILSGDLSGSTGEITLFSGADIDIRSNDGRIQLLTSGTTGLTSDGIDIASSSDLELSAADGIYIPSHVYFDERNDGNSGTEDTIDWSLDNKHRSTLTGDVTYTFTAPAGPTNLLLRIIQGSGAYTTTWPATVKWVGGTPPTIPIVDGDISIVGFYFDGTNYYGQFAGAFS